MKDSIKEDDEKFEDLYFLQAMSKLKKDIPESIEDKWERKLRAEECSKIMRRIFKRCDG